MAIPGIEQPDMLPITDSLRLRKYDGVHDFALKWYQDVELVYLVDGDKEPYSPDRLTRMYQYLSNAGELYFIEVWEGDAFQPIGDVTFWQEDMPIVIADSRYRGKKIGRQVISALIQRGKALGFPYVSVGEIYRWNEPSRRCFESLGFRAYEKTEKGAKYRLTL